MLDGVQWPSTRGNQITSRDARARIRTLQEFCVFCCHKYHITLITHYIITIYIDFRNNFPHCHTFTLLLHPQKSPKYHPQNNFSTSNPKQHVVFSKTTHRFGDDEVFSIPSTVTLVTAKNKTRSTGSRIHSRVRTPSASTANTTPSSSQSSKTNTHLHHLHTYLENRR